ncbi:MAG: hypothetical protein ACJAYH_001696 [Celeribacter sp.]|jgi:hypothetical protein
MSKRKQHHPEFKAKVALEALKGEETVSRFGVQTRASRWMAKAGSWTTFLSSDCGGA